MAVPRQPRTPNPPGSDPRVRLGVDVGGTLAKLAIARGEGRVDYRLVPANGIERLALEVEQIAPDCVGLTGGGANLLARTLTLDTTAVGEFDAWGAGSCALLAGQGFPSGGRHLLVSLGTGTSIMLADGDRVTRVGGTALGGGTLMGLGAALTGAADFEALVTLASAGDRRRVDLLVSDIYREGNLPLPGELTASSFAKLGDPARRAPAAAPDLAHGLVGLVGENVGLLCATLAAVIGVKRIVFGGTTLRANPPLAAVLTTVCTRLGCEAVFLRNGEYAGALGALEIAARG